MRTLLVPTFRFRVWLAACCALVMLLSGCPAGEDRTLYQEIAFTADGARHENPPYVTAAITDSAVVLDASDYSGYGTLAIEIRRYVGDGVYDLSDSTVAVAWFRRAGPVSPDDPDPAFTTARNGGSGFVEVDARGCWTDAGVDPFTGIDVTLRFCTVAGEFDFVGVNGAGAELRVTDGRYRITGHD